jgi:hypothetical protein
MACAPLPLPGARVQTRAPGSFLRRYPPSSQSRQSAPNLSATSTDAKRCVPPPMSALRPGTKHSTAACPSRRALQECWTRRRWLDPSICRSTKPGTANLDCATMRPETYSESRPIPSEPGPFRRPSQDLAGPCLAGKGLAGQGLTRGGTLESPLPPDGALCKSIGSVRNRGRRSIRQRRNRALGHRDCVRTRNLCRWNHIAQRTLALADCLTRPHQPNGNHQHCNSLQHNKRPFHHIRGVSGADGLLLGCCPRIRRDLHSESSKLRAICLS